MTGRTSALRRRNEARCERLLGRSGLVESDDLAWDEVGATEVDPATLECLVYMRDVEGFTDRDLVGLAGHPATLADPLINRFLDAWRAEEAEHARVLDRFLTTYATQRGAALPSRQAPPPAVVPLRERLLLGATRPVGHVIVAAHMAWGAANELLTLNGYRLLAERADHPVLTPLLGRIADQETRHYSFYRLQAEWRLDASGLARRLLHRILDRTWTPVGIGDGYKAPGEFDRVLAHLSGGEEGDRLVARLDAGFSRLPGFGDLRIFAEATDRSRRRLAAAEEGQDATPVIRPSRSAVAPLARAA